MDTRLPEDFIPENWRGNRNDNQSSVTINNLGKVSYILLAMLCGLALGVSIIGVILGVRESQILITSMDAKAAGMRSEVAAARVDIEHYKQEFQKLAEAYKDLKTQNWLLERRLMDKEALDILHGTKLPSDIEFGPTGNMQRMKPKEK